MDQPGAGGSHSYKIRAHSRPKRSTKPYARPSGQKKGVLETVKDFFSPSWLVDFWKGKSSSEEVEVEEDVEVETRLSGDTVRVPEDPNKVFEAPNPRVFAGTSTGSGESRVKVFGNGGLGSLHVHGRSKGKNALSTFLAAKSSYRTIRETTTIRESENETSTAETTRRKEDNSESDAATLSSNSRRELQIQQASSSSGHLFKPEGRTPSPSTMFLNPGLSRKALPSSFITSTPMSGPSNEPGTSGSSGLISTPTETSTPVNTSGTPAPTPSASLLMFAGQQTDAKARPASAFKSKPSFSVTAFGSPLPPRPRSQGSMHPYASPFYPGRTSFGGTASQRLGTKRLRVTSPKTSSEASQPVKKQIRPTPIPASGSGGVASQTAKRILEALEKMSTPLMDAKKVPPSPPFSTSSSPLSFTQRERRRPPPSARAVGSPRKLKAQFGAPPVQALSVPQRAAISRVQTKTTPEASSAAAISTAVPGRLTEPIASYSETAATYVTQPLSSFTPTPLPMSFSPETAATSRGGGKIKRDRTTAHYASGRIRLEEQDETEVVNPLPQVTAVPLQFAAGTSFPSFSFAGSAVTATSTKTDTISIMATKSQDITKNNFKFSAPATKVSTSSASSTKKPSSTSQAFSFSQPAPVMKSDVFKSDTSDKGASTPGFSLDKFKPAEGTWECETCMIYNKSSDANCVACQSPKPKPKTSEVTAPSNDLLAKFAPPKDSWTCDTCMIVNKFADSKCIACQSPKPRTAGFGTPSAGQLSSKSDDSLMKKFAPPAGSWECDTCMINNKGNDVKCVACETPKPGAKPAMTSAPSFRTDDTLMKKFAPAAGTWECDTCMINNKASDNKCVACETPKPGAKPAMTSASSFGATASSTDSLLAKFAPAPGSWTCDTCMVVNKPELVKCIACETPKPGAEPPKSTGAFKLVSGTSLTSSPFKFGVDKTKDSAAQPAFSFGVEDKPAFQFGIPTSDNAASSAPKITFGVPAASMSSSSSASKPTFQFGVPASKEGASAATFTFGVGSSDSKPAIQFGVSTTSSGSTQSSTEGSAKPALTFGANSGSAKATETSTTASPAKKSSIATAAAAGFLKVPGMTTPSTGNAEAVSKPLGSQTSIGDATKAGFLKIPTAGDSAPPNVNLFGASSSSKPEASQFAGLSNPTVSETLEKPPQPSDGATLPSLPFAFGASNTKPTEPSKPFSFPGTSAGATEAAKFPTLDQKSAPPKVTPFSFTAGTGSDGSTSLPKIENKNTPSASLTAGFTAGIGTNVQPQGNTSSASSVPPFSFTGATTTTSAGTAFQPPPPAAAAPFAFGGAPGAFNFNGAASGVTANLGGTTGIGGTPGTFSFTATSTSAPAPAASSASAFAFGGTPATATPAASGFSFSAAPSAGATQKPAFGGFGAPQPFVFGGANPAMPTVSEESMDADGNNNNSQTAVAAPAQLGAPGGIFGPAPSAAPSAPGGFAFGQPSTSTGFNFSGATQQPSMFKFGASEPAVPPQFPIGGAPPAFGAPAAQPPAATGGFNFSAPNSGAAPSFNFGGGSGGPIGGFTAGAGDTASPATKRVIKRGVRRSRRGAQ